MRMRSFKYRLGSSSKINIHTQQQIRFQSKLRPIFTEHYVNHQNQKLYNDNNNLQIKKDIQLQNLKQNFCKFKQKGISMHTGVVGNKQNRTSIFQIKNRSNSNLKFSTVKKNIIQHIADKRIDCIEKKPIDTILQSQNLPFQVAQAENQLEEILKQSKQQVKSVQSYLIQLQQIRSKIFRELEDIQTKSLGRIRYLWHELQKNKTHQCGMMVNWKQTIQRQSLKQGKQKELIQQVKNCMEKLQKVVNFQ